MKRMTATTLSVMLGSAMMLGMGSLAAEDQANGMDDDKYMSSKPEGAFHANDLIGNTVKGAEDEEVGSINDLIIDEDGQIVGVVVGVGGFLGIGDKDIAMSWDEIELTHDAEDDEYILRTDADEEMLDSAPEYDGGEGGMLE
ncbi:PRC-barrel domain-containing protein [Aquisalimonas sp.]|uniref:PRC-barrel domain-containing protein n=1 Tax=Aquisalimonas sp. TaxID=1872621 RepID=UPI0025BC22F1|nr:PRC-barrel domain-containing protein [Aquisalimonas sp.]